MKKEYAKYLLNGNKKNYSEFAKEFSAKRAIVWPELEFLFDNYLMAGDRVLDSGCGNGRFYEVFKDKDVSYVGVDFSETLIEIAKNNYPKTEFRAANALDLDFPNNFFDKIFSIAVLHHIPSKDFRLKFLKEARRILKPGGFLILTVWNLWSYPKKRIEILKSNLKKILGISRLDFNDIIIPSKVFPKIYFHCFTKKELEDLVLESNFKLKESGFLDRGSHKKANIYLAAEK